MSRRKSAEVPLPHHLDELLQLGDVLQLGIAVQQQGGVVCIGQRLQVEHLQVGGQVVYPLSVQELADDVRRLQFPNSAKKRTQVPVAGIKGCRSQTSEQLRPLAPLQWKQAQASLGRK